MTIYDLKPAFQNLLRPICRALAAAGATANQVTLAALLGSLFVGLLFAFNPDSRWAAWLIPVWLFVRMALNAIDGMLAREHHMQSRLGGILNELGDVVSDTVLYLPFALVPGLWRRPPVRRAHGQERPGLRLWPAGPATGSRNQPGLVDECGTGPRRPGRRSDRLPAFGSGAGRMRRGQRS